MQKKVVAKGVGASPGLQKGWLSFSAADAERRAREGAKIVFLCDEAGSEDRAGLEACVAVVSVRGGLTGDAAIMARALGKPCVVGVAGARVQYTDSRVVFRDPSGAEITLDVSSELTVDGKSGELAIFR